MTIIEFYGGPRDGEREIVPPRRRKRMKTMTSGVSDDDGETTVYKFAREEKRGNITVWIFAVDPDAPDLFADREG